MTKEDMLEIERLSQLKTANMGDKHSCEQLIIKYINPGARYCKTCDPAVRQMFKVLKNWWESQNKEAYTFIKTK